MRKFSWLVLLLFPAMISAQQSADTNSISKAAGLNDLSFTTPELDSMQEGVKENQSLYREMHKLSVPNSLNYPFAFNPVPPGFVMPVKQSPVQWNIPLNVKMPA